MLFRRILERRGTSVTLSLASSSASPAPPTPPPLSSPAAIGAPASSGLQLHSRPWLPSGLELDGPTLAASSVEEQETETSLALSPPVTGSSFFLKTLSYPGSAFRRLSMSLPESLLAAEGQLVALLVLLGKLGNAGGREDPEC